MRTVGCADNRHDVAAGRFANDTMNGGAAVFLRSGGVWDFARQFGHFNVRLREVSAIAL